MRVATGLETVGLKQARAGGHEAHIGGLPVGIAYGRAHGVADEAAAAGQLAHVRIYLAHWRLGRLQEAEQAFGRVVALGIAISGLGVKLLFNPGRPTSGPIPRSAAPMRSGCARSHGRPRRPGSAC
ncbi:hypothetical protein SNE35_02185 [Paucibacter sp. R3-3]|uniref:Uncharacterized protein n=1 Tax=Roseateles agri TaxID=3098619 RepID=A0ABU5DDP9_9BURK|nr:hypothetical protein [Paucibacter sp. R3-3]MDY0743292.1 hypothetical protein [Paucibacter sp. R3-3]